jgi:hypothetical protein
MKHYDVRIQYQKGSLCVIIEKKDLVDFIARYCKGAKEINVKEIYFDSEGDC